VKVLDTPSPPPTGTPGLAVYEPRPDDPRVTLDLDPEARWVSEQYPLEEVERLDRGRLRVTLAVSERAWLERLLLRLGRRAHMISGDRTVGPEAAQRLLRRYRRETEPGPEPG
jgi:proteasome accessory factor C